MRDNKGNCHPKDVDFLHVLNKEMLFEARVSHLFSGVYNEPPDYVNLIADTAISGFSEWGSRDYPVISIGWDWSFEMKSNEVVLEVCGAPFCNVLITGPNLPEIGCEQIFREYIDTLDWKPEVLAVIKKRFN